jgi:hypothetical protein
MEGWLPSIEGWGRWGDVGQTSVICWINSGDLMYSMVTLGNNGVMYTWNLPERIDLKYSHQAKKELCKVIDILISLIMLIVSQCIHIPDHHIAHLQYIQFSFVSYISIRLKKERNYKRHYRTKANRL